MRIPNAKDDYAEYIERARLAEERAIWRERYLAHRSEDCGEPELSKPIHVDTRPIQGPWEKWVYETERLAKQLNERVKLLKGGRRR